MLNNRRSTKNIIDFMNGIRTDLKQEPFRVEDGEIPVLLIGRMNTALEKSVELSENNPVYSLSRLNVTSNLMKRDIKENAPNGKLFDELLNADKPSSSNHYRSKIVAACIKAVEFARQNRFKDAIKELSKTFASGNNRDKGRKEGLKTLILLLSKYNSFKDESLYKFYELIRSDIRSEISALRAGNAKTFYDGHSYLQMAVCVNIVEDESLHRTIHKAKGAEFDNVLLVLENEKDLAFIQNPNIEDEEHRINYVAVSRAKNKLFINVPQLSPKNESELKQKLSIYRIP